MVHDLDEAHARLQQCYVEVDALASLIANYLEQSFEIRAVWADYETDIQARLLNPVPIEIRTKIGSIVNEVRSVLDHLVSILAERNGFSDSKKSYFPMSESAAKFRDNGRRQIADLSQDDQDLLAGLQPIGVNNPILYGFHEFDIVRKHRRLSVHVTDVDGFGITPLEENLEITFLRPVVPSPTVGVFWSSIYKLRTRNRVRLIPNKEVRFTGPRQLAGTDVIKGIRGFISSARDIVGMF